MIQVDRLIVGAGISGLLAALRARTRGESVVVVERASNPGGLVAPVTIAGIDIDAGAEAFSTAGDSFFQLITELGLGDQVISPQRSDARIIASSTLRYVIPHGVLGIPSSLDDPELNMIISPEGLHLARQLDSQPVAVSEDMTVAELVSSRLGPEFVDKLVDPLCTGVYGSSAHTLSTHSTIPSLMKALKDSGSLCSAAQQLRTSGARPGSAVAGIAGGLFTLVSELIWMLEQRGVRFFFDSEVKDINKQQEFWQCVTSSEEFLSSELTIATGIGSAAYILQGIEPSDGCEMPEILETHSVDIALVFLLVESHDLDSAPLGSGALLTAQSGATAKAATHINAKWEWVQDELPPHHHLIRLSYGRDGALPEGDLIDLARQDLPVLFGICDATIHSTVVQHWPGSLFQSSAAAQKQCEQLARCATALGIELCGSYVSGNGLLGITRDHYQRMTP